VDKRQAGAPLDEGGAGIGGSSSPPEGLFDLMGDIAAGQADVMQVPVGPLRELTAALVALAPDVQGLAELGQKAWNMMICHRFVGISGHFQLLELIFAGNICGFPAFCKRHFVPLRMI
jgi:hypothetical protein